MMAEQEKYPRCPVCGLAHEPPASVLECTGALRQQNMKYRLYLEQRMNRLLAETHAIGQYKCDGCTEATDIWKLLGDAVEVRGARRMLAEADAAALKEPSEPPCRCSPGDTCICAYDCSCRAEFKHTYDSDEGWSNEGPAAALKETKGN